jgi:large subunit ribosomal protein L6
MEFVKDPIQKITRQVKMSLGFAHPIRFNVPKDMLYRSVRESGKDRRIFMFGINKAQVTSTTAQIYDFKRPDVYRGAGFRYPDEIIKLKVGKKK